MEEAPSTSVDAPATRDIPLPSRRLRIGLGNEDLNSVVKTTEIPVTKDEEQYLPSVSAPKARAHKVAAPPVRTPQSETEPDVPAPSGRHRLPAPSSALKARTALVAIAAGAGTFAALGSGTDQAAPNADPAPESEVSLAAAGTSGAGAAPSDAPGTAPAAAPSGPDLGPGVTAATVDADMSGFGSQLSEGKKIKAAKVAAEEAAKRPKIVSPVDMGAYDLTSAFAPRWGAFHGGIDMAAPLGTPIHAATDGVVKEAGPSSGYGNWVLLEAPDGTVTMYGHMASSGVLAKVGQKVTAGDVIALVGSEGFSTGPHLHFEVWRDGKMKTDPGIWLAKKGVRLSGLTS
nr:M23 family metallopeptidase [Gordonia zhaorongruii]